MALTHDRSNTGKYAASKLTLSNVNTDNAYNTSWLI